MVACRLLAGRAWLGGLIHWPLNFEATTVRPLATLKPSQDGTLWSMTQNCTVLRGYHLKIRATGGLLALRSFRTSRILEPTLPKQSNIRAMSSPVNVLSFFTLGVPDFSRRGPSGT